jgi:hypothetical protein
MRPKQVIYWHKFVTRRRSEEEEEEEEGRILGNM